VVQDLAVRLRIGVLLWFLSWVPYGIILGLSGAAYTLAWAFEILLGFIGLGLVGSQVAQAIKETSWKRAPAIMWHAFLHGSDVENSGSTTPAEPAEPAAPATPADEPLTP
jgi:hypothetical protein